LTSHSGLLFVTLGAQLVNDDSPECRKMVARCLETMLERLDKNARNQLFDIVIVWFKDNKVEHYILFYRILSVNLNLLIHIRCNNICWTLQSK
jgi:U3 small nucleolar RNA-associated protein 20